MGEEGDTEEEMSFQVMTNVAEGVGGQTLVYLNILYKFPHSSYFI